MKAGPRRLIGAFAALALAAGSALPAPIDANDVRVIDGDTIRVHHQKPDVRLVGFNAPETRRAQCVVALRIAIEGRLHFLGII